MTITGPLARSGTILLTTDATTRRLGETLAAVLSAGDALLLYGDLGSGKTTLARALILKAAPDVREVPSPTFTLVQTYEGATPIWHADLYRLSDVSELAELGLEDAFDHALCIVEWPDRLGADAPTRRLSIELRLAAGDAREAVWRCVGDGWERVATALEGFSE
ncbi:MAG: tRNA (adenosine(37)-N6)-threonylcarbamoyltransferase complex ATPase subunit type 1 TsaE [Pseudomonadota bacterium]